MAAIKNFFVGIGVYAIPVLSIMAMVLVFYIPRFTEFWNYLRLAPFYAGIYFWISQRPDAFNGISAFVLGIFADVVSAAPARCQRYGFFGFVLSRLPLFRQFQHKKVLLFLDAVCRSRFRRHAVQSTHHQRFLPGIRPS